MKPIHIASISFGAAVFGFVGGVGLGLLGGLRETNVMRMAGMCMPVKTALSAGLLTQVEAEALAISIGQEIQEHHAELANAFEDVQDVESSTHIKDEFCTGFLSKVVQTVGFVRTSEEIHRDSLPPASF